MDNSKIAGCCPGAALDATRMFDLVKPISNSAVCFKSDEAIKNDVVSAMKDACTGSDLTIIFYAGHGGSQKMKQYAPEEVDGKDEMIFLWDTYMLDDEIWDIISKASGRVFLMFDCCHSETMFRIAPPIDFCASVDDESERAKKVNMICWSGCADNKTSIGSSSGGEFTNAFIRSYDKKLTYNQLWDKLQSDKKLKKYEIIKQTKLGNDFGSELIFN